MKIKVALDVDGVLANFYLAFCLKCKRPIETIDHWDLKWISENFGTIIDDHEFWSNLPVLNSPESISFDFDYYITSLPENLRPAREEWLSKNGFPDKPVIISYDKAAAMKELGVDVLIDDKYQTVKEVDEAGFVSIQYVPYYFQPKNLHSINVRNLHDVNSVIDNLIK